MTSYTNLIESLQLNLIAFDHTANSQYQVFKSAPLDGITMFLGISTNNTLSTFMQNGVMMMQRSSPFGGDEVISAAMNTAGFNDSQFAEAIDLSTDEQWMQTNLTPDVYNSATTRLITGISRSADFFKSAYKGANIDKVVLLGSCAKIVSLKDAIQSTLNVDAITIEELPGINKVIDSVNSSAFASCLGGAIAPLDLIPAEMRQIKQKSAEASAASLKMPILLLIVSVVAGAALSGLSFLDFMAVQGELTKTENRIEELSYVTETYNKYIQFIELENNIKILDDSTSNNNEGLRTFLEELERKMPSDLILLSASCDDGGVSMNIEVETMDDAAVVISQLRTFESIDSLLISPISESESEVGTLVTSFSVSCLYSQTELALTEVPAPIVPEEEPATETQP